MPRLLLGTLALVAALLGASVITGPALGATPVGSEFQVNTYTTGHQLYPSVAVASDGDFVVVWHSNGSAGSDTSFFSIQGQRYDASGNALGGEFQVNTYTTYRQDLPSVAVDAGGDFVVVWGSDGSAGSDTSGRSVQGQRYDASGNPVGVEFQVNTYTTDDQMYASAAVDADGDFVVVWNSDGSAGSDTDTWSIQGQRYDASGNVVGAEFQVNTYTTDDQWVPSVAVDADGDFVVVWYSNGSAGSDTSSYSIQGQRYDASGNPVGAEFQVNTYTNSFQTDPSVAMSADEGFVIAWHGGDQDEGSIQSQRYDASGNALGGEFQVNTYTTLSQSHASVAIDADGGFVVVWTSRGSTGNDTSFYSIQGQRYDASGNAVGAQFQINTFTTLVQISPSVAVNVDGDFVVVWDSDGSAGTDTLQTSIQAQRYLPEPSEFLMLAAGIALLAAVGRRRIKA
jgi:hypothetical protein